LRKVLNTLTALLLLSALSSPVASYADEPDTTETEGYESEHHDELELRHSQIEETFEDYSGVFIPPVIIHLGHVADPNIYILPILPADELIQAGLPDEPKLNLQPIGVVGEDQPTTIDPYKHAPLPLDSIVLTSKTPADEFMDGARVFGAGLIAAALFLLAVTGLSTIRSRKRKSIQANSSGQ
jgi:hypothetical protein